jgi:uncharacterized membrane protein YphA (DoxX/SURF4 family)
MNHVMVLARIVFASGMMAFGVLRFVYADSVFGLGSLPAWLPGHEVWAYLTGAVLSVFGACILLNAKTRAAAIAVGILLSLP